MRVTTPRPSTRVRHRFTAAIAVLVTVAACGTPAGSSTDETYEITLAVPGSEDGMTNGTTWWANEINERTDGRVDIEIFYDGSLLSAVDVLPGVQDGRATAGWLSDPYWPTEFSLWQMVGIPFETTDGYAGARAFYDLYQEQDAFRDQFHDAGVHMLHFVPFFPTMLGSREPVTGLSDLKGKRLRAAGYVGKALEQVGAQPVAMDPLEMYESIQRGVLDGYAGFPLDVVTEFSLHEVAPHTVDLGVGHYASSGVGINLEFWNSLPDELRNIITEVSEELQTEQAMVEFGKIDEQVCDSFASSDARLSVLPESEVERWRDQLGDSVLDAWRAASVEAGVAAQVADDVHAAYLETYRRHEAESSYENPVPRCARQLAGD